MRIGVSLLAMCCLVSTVVAKEIPGSKAERVGMSTERLERIAEMNARYTDSGRIPGVLTAVVRDGRVVHRSASGIKGAGDDRLLEMDDLFRIYSMSKPITATAAMQLYEQGKFQLKDKVSKYVPEFKELTVMKNGEVVPAEGEMTMQQLLSHTAGLSYGFDPNDAVDKMYWEAKLWQAKDLDDFVERLAALPLKYEPGERFHYSIAVDVTGLIVQRLSGQRFDAYLQDHIFEPLDMVDSSFSVPADKMDRLLPNHVLDTETGKAKAWDMFKEPEAAGYLFSAGCHALCDYGDVTLYSGGAGLVSTLRDYVRFAEAIRNGGILDGKRILSPKTIAYMTMNHLPASIIGGTGEQVTLGGNQFNGFGFGLGFAVVTDTAAQGIIGSAGQFWWGGAAGTIFWIDPAEDIVVVSMMQLMRGQPSYRPDLRVATYQALTRSRE